LTYFEDAESEEIPILFQKLDWNEIKVSIQNALNDFNN
jgi:hypothetical protein